MESEKMPRKAARSPGNSTTSAQAIARARKIARAVELRVRGLTFEQIAKEMGEGSIAGAYRLVKEGLDRIIREPAEDLRKVEIERLDAALRAVAPLATREVGTIVKIKNQETGKMEEVEVGPHLQALDRYLKISESRRKLLGLDGAEAIDPTVSQVSEREWNDQFMKTLGRIAKAIEDNGGD